MRSSSSTTPSPSPTQPSALHSPRDPRELVASFFSTRGFEAHEGPKLTSVLKLKSASLRLGDFCIVIRSYPGFRTLEAGMAVFVSRLEDNGT
ncbi:unnamed protein product [Sphagnum balticum]